GGPAVEDECGVCDADPNNDCVQNCNGEWGGDLNACGNLWIWLGFEGNFIENRWSLVSTKYNAEEELVNDAVVAQGAPTEADVLTYLNWSLEPGIYRLYLWGTAGVIDASGSFYVNGEHLADFDGTLSTHGSYFEIPVVSTPE
ncbi:MAG: hypothetical protein CMH54_15370, partial [Myxococcales bacterium]|nr:hypothetical protein [Myxococcales bacterium]